MRGERTAIWKKKYCLNSHSSNSSEKVLLIARALSYSVFLLHARSNLSRKSWHSKRTEWTYTLIKKKHKNKKRRMFVSTLCASKNNNNQKSPESSLFRSRMRSQQRCVSFVQYLIYVYTYFSNSRDYWKPPIAHTCSLNGSIYRRNAHTTTEDRKKKTCVAMIIFKSIVVFGHTYMYCLAHCTKPRVCAMRASHSTLIHTNVECYMYIVDKFK